MQPPSVRLDLSVLPLDLILWVGLILAVVVFGIYSALMLWHWKEYSTGKFTTVANMVVYLGVGAACLLVMGLATVWYHF